MAPPVDKRCRCGRTYRTHPGAYFTDSVPGNATLRQNPALAAERSSTHWLPVRRNNQLHWKCRLWENAATVRKRTAQARHSRSAVDDELFAGFGPGFLQFRRRQG